MSMETEQTRRFMDNWKRQAGDSLWWHKIPDPVYGESTGTRAVDVVACYKGVMLGLEFKLRNKETGFRHEKIRQAQVETMNAIKLAGGKAYLILLTRLSPTNKYAHIVPFHDLRVAQLGHDNGFYARKSFQPDDFFAVHRTTQVRRGPYVDWDLTNFIRSIDGH